MRGKLQDNLNYLNVQTNNHNNIEETDAETVSISTCKSLSEKSMDGKEASKSITKTFTFSIWRQKKTQYSCENSVFMFSHV